MRDFNQVLKEKEEQVRQCLSDIAAIRRTIELCEEDPGPNRAAVEKQIGEDVLETEWQNEESPPPQKEVTKVIPLPSDQPAAKMKRWP